VAVDAEEREGGEPERTERAREVSGDGLHTWFADARARRIISLAPQERQLAAALLEPLPPVAEMKQ
jgi:hypothetical protein